MPRRFISQLGEHESVDDVFLASEKQLRTNRNGNLYLQMRLSDRTGSVMGMMWNANDRLYASFDNGDYLQVQATTQFYNGTLQMIVSRVERAVAEKVVEADFITLGVADVEKMARELAELLHRLRQPLLRDLADQFLQDEVFMRRFCTAPAGIKNHHAYRGGLLEHVLSLLRLAALVGPLYPRVDSDLLLIGAFLHDIGKTIELNYVRDLSYSDQGQLIGHLVLGVEMLDEKIKAVQTPDGQPFPDELAWRLKHMILSHHGEYEFGSPKLPMTLEAIALHHLDNLDSKLHTVTQLLTEDANSESNWTPFHGHLGRKFFKGNGD